MDSSIFCVLCGGPFELESHIYNIDTEREAFQWINSVHLLGSPEAISPYSDLVILGDDEDLQNTSNSDDVFLSMETSWTSMDGDLLRIGNSFVQVLSDHDTGEVMFPLHGSCIAIASRVIETRHTPSRTRSSLARLNRALQDQFRFRKYFAGGVGNDLFDLYAEYSNYGPRSLLAIDELGWWGDAHEKFLMDPINIPNLTSFLFSAVQATPRRCSRAALIGLPERWPQELERLPTEILDRITEFLPPKSIIALHRTSRTLARNVPLDERFWRNHILDGSLLPHIWDLTREQLEYPRPGDQQSGSCFDIQWGWKSIVKLLFKKEFPLCGGDSRLEGVPLGFWNRCRIWKIVEEACPAQAKIRPA
ncbi:hypothetical protein BDV96DRAFT_287519 [Lophiotrema nucula]|uniref:F-box domain-containing protein n=1 Tax=Lophiotrema nucula TaxID=690887 RepID=A0A6A5YN16_9PLEO|nr:hypothetical protein BDV96DRAFT_287519 [Lophiotrema nucula]